MEFDLACFGFVCPQVLARVARYPGADDGTIVTDLLEQLCADAPITALVAAHLGCRVGFLGNDLGQDERGQHTLRILREAGVETSISLNRETQTPWTFAVSDEEGRRTWFSYLPGVLDSLMKARLDMISQAKMLYVDAYELFREASIRAIRYANENGIPLFVNLSADLLTSDLAKLLQGRVLILQANGEHLSPASCRELIASYLQLGALYVLLTLGASGTFYASQSEILHTPAFKVKAVNNAGPGAAFSAGIAYGYLHGWPLSTIVTFASATAAVFCSVPDGINQTTLSSVSVLLKSLP